MIHRSFDLKKLLQIVEPYTDLCPIEDFVTWFSRPKNMLFLDGNNAGIASYQYPGVYMVHWYFSVRGRQAIDLGKAMIKNLFENYDAETVCALIKTKLKASRWAARQVGFKSQGIVMYPDGDENELFTLTKDEFLNSGKENTNG